MPGTPPGAGLLNPYLSPSQRAPFLVRPPAPAPLRAPPIDPYGSMIFSTVGAVAYWRLGESDPTMSARDEFTANDGHYNYGSPPSMGIPSAIVGTTNTAVRFNGGNSNQVSVPASSTLDVGDNFSIELWVMRGSGSIGSALTVIASKGNVGGAVPAFEADNTISLYGGSLGKAAGSSIAITDTTTWHHLVFTKDGTATGAKIYIDGVDRTTGAASVTFANTSQPFTIASDSPNGAYATMDADDVALYNRALTPAEVLLHYQTGSGAAGNRDSGPIVIQFTAQLSSSRQKGGQAAPAITLHPTLVMVSRKDALSPAALSHHPAIAATARKGGLITSTLTARPAIVVVAARSANSAASITFHPSVVTQRQKGGQISVVLTEHPALTAVVQKGGQGLVSPTTHPSLTASTQKGAVGSASLTAHPTLAVVSFRLIGGTASLTFHAATSAQSQKGAQIAAAITAHRALAVSSSKGASAATSTTTHPALTASIRKGAIGSPAIIAHPVFSTSSIKAASGTSSITIHPAFFVTGGPPAQSQPKLTFHPNLAVAVTKQTSGSASVTTHPSITVTSRKGSQGSVVCTLHPNTTVSGQKTALLSASLTTHPALTTSIRKGASVVAQLTVRPAIIVIPSQRALGTATLAFHPALSITYVVHGLANPIRPLNTSGYIEQVRSGNLVGADTGDIESPTTGSIR